MRKETLWLGAIFLARGDAFSSIQWPVTSRSSITTRSYVTWMASAATAAHDEGSQITASSLTATDPTTQTTRPLCFYRSRSRRGQWTPRIELADLAIGQELPDAHIVQELLDGTTGPKLFVDCGVGRYKSSHTNNKWQIQTAMVRLAREKPSVTTKRVARLRKKPFFPVYVSKIRLENDQLEVCLQRDQVVEDKPFVKLTSVSALPAGQECVGTIRRVEPYGVLVALDGVNRLGLLHIQKVADLYGQFINKVEGLNMAGLERGARIKVQVVANEKKRLFLDFTEDVKKSALEEVEERKRQKEEKSDERKRRKEENKERKESASPPRSSSSLDSGGAVATVTSLALNYGNDDSDPFAEEAAVWAAMQKDQQEKAGDTEIDEDDDYEDDDYDEDGDIEDSFGLGSY